MHTILPGLTRHNFSNMLPHLLTRHPVAEVEPCPLLLRPAIARGALVVRRPHGGVDERHGVEGVGAEGDARAYLGEGWGRLIQVDGDALFEEADGECHAADAGTGDGDGEGFLWGRGGCRGCHGGCRGCWC